MSPAPLEAEALQALAVSNEVNMHMLNYSKQKGNPYTLQKIDLLRPGLNRSRKRARNQKPMKKSLFFAFSALVLFGFSFSAAHGAEIDTVRRNIADQLRAHNNALTPAAQSQISSLRKQLSVCLSTGRQCQIASSPRIINGEIYTPPPGMRFPRGLPPIGPIGRIAPAVSSPGAGTVSPVTNFFRGLLGR